MLNRVRNYLFQFSPLLNNSIALVIVYDANNNTAIGELDFFGTNTEGITEDIVEKWWSLGDARNRGPVYIQGQLVR